MKIRIASIVTIAVLLAAPLAAQTGEALFQQGLAKQNADGDIQGAIQIYERITREFSSSPLLARTLIQLGRCYELLGQAKAIEYYRQVIAKHGDQADSVKEARSRIALLQPAKAASYSGDIVSLDFRDYPLQDFFRLIGQISGLNIILAPNVDVRRASLTMRLVEVPWDQALDVVLKTFQLASRLSGKILTISSISTSRSNAPSSAVPIVSLPAQPTLPPQPAAGSSRPSGVRGLSIADVAVVGIVISKDAGIAVAIVKTPRGPMTYIIKPNDALFDAIVKEIQPDAVVFTAKGEDVVRKIQPAR